MSSFAVRRRVTVLMGVLVVLMLGYVSFTRISVDLFPRLDFPAAAVLTEYPGAAPSEVESLVTRVVEEVMGQVARVKSLSSISLEERSVVVVRFEWGTDMDYATLQMREKLDLVSDVFPDEVRRPIVAAFDPSALPVMFVTVTGPGPGRGESSGEDGAGTTGGADPEELDRYLVGLTRWAEDTVKRRLERVEGVASVSLIGDTEDEVLIAVDRERLAASGVSWLGLTQALAGTSLNLPGGVVGEDGTNLLVRSLGELAAPEELEGLLVGVRKATVPTPLGPQTVPVPVRLGDVAGVAVRPRHPEDLSRLGGEPSVVLSVQKASDANTVAVSRAVREALADLEDELPQGYSLTVTMDQADFIGKAVGFVEQNAWQGALLAVLVLLLFLRDIRSVLVIGLAIPISVVATFTLMYFTDLTLNLMTVGGLALGVGMLVDNSIVVLENIFRHLEEGEDPGRAAVAGTAEVVTAITASTLTTVVVFLPVVFVGGIAGTLFKELAITVTFSLLSSLAVAVTFVPAAAVTLFGAGAVRARSSGMRSGYGRLIRGALRSRAVVLVVVFLALGLSLTLADDIGTEFVPPMDRGEVIVSVSLPEGSDLESTDEVVRRVERVVMGVPEARFVTSTVGSSGGLLLDVAGVLGGGSHVGSVDLRLVDRAERDRSAEEVAQDLRRELRMVRGGEISVQPLTSFMALAGIRPVEVVLSGDEPDVLAELARRVAAVVREVPGTANVDDGAVPARPEVHIAYDRDKLAALGLHPAVVASTVRGAIEGQVVGLYNDDGRSLDVVLRYDDRDREGLQAVEDFVVAVADGRPVRLKEVARVTRGEGPSAIQREGGRRVQVVSALVEGRDLASVTGDLTRRLEELEWPDGYEYRLEGEDLEMREAFSGLGLAFGLAVVLVYMVMAAQFESLGLPLVIMLTLPLAAAGVLPALRFGGVTFSVPSYIGVIMLAGIVVNNAIVLLDFIRQLRASGLPRDEAVRTAAGHRLRPILMTTTTTVLGLVPMAFARLEGSELARSLAVTVIGGLTVSTLLTLVVIPVAYTLLDDFLCLVRGRPAGVTRVEPAPETPGAGRARS